jgi:hypothetical protein
MAVVLQGVKTLHSERAEFAQSGHLAILGGHGGEIESGIGDGDVAGQANDTAHEVLAKSGPKLGEKVDTPNVNMGGRQERGKRQVLIEEHIGIAANGFATDREVKSKRAEAFDGHMQVVGGCEIVPAEVIKSNDGLENSETAFGNKGLDGKCGYVVEGRTSGGTLKLVERANRFAVKAGKDGVKKRLVVKEIEGTTKSRVGGVVSVREVATDTGGGCGLGRAGIGRKELAVETGSPSGGRSSGRGEEGRKSRGDSRVSEV